METKYKLIFSKHFFERKRERKKTFTKNTFEKEFFKNIWKMEKAKENCFAVYLYFWKVIFQFKSNLEIILKTII